MGHSEQLRVHEVRAVYEILGQVIDLGLVPELWRPHMLDSLSRLVGARVGLTMDLKNALPGHSPIPIQQQEFGLGDGRQMQHWLRYLQSSQLKLEDPSNVAIFDLHQRRQFFTRTREQLVDSKTWYASPVVSEARRASDVDHFVASSMKIFPSGFTSGFILYRSWGDTPFHARCQKILRLFHLELLKRLWPTGEFTPPQYAAMPRHLRMVVRATLAGKSAKEISRDMGLSVHTINSYTKELHTRLGVESRGEIFSKFLNRPNGRPVMLPVEFET